MRVISIFIFLMILTFCVSCISEDEPKAIELEPLHYSFLPLYPNSYWYYQNEEGTIDTFYTEEYHIRKAICFGPEENAKDSFKTTTLYREPVLPDLKYIYGYTSYECSPSPFFPNTYEIVLSEKIGDNWSVDRKDPRYFDKEHRKTTVQINGELLIIKEFEKALKMGVTIDTSIFYLETYQKNIGLIDRIRINTNSNDTVTELKLVDYKMNK